MFERTKAQQREALARSQFETNLAKFVLENPSVVAPAVHHISQKLIKLLLINCHIDKQTSRASRQTAKAGQAGRIGSTAATSGSNFQQGLQTCIDFLFNTQNFAHLPVDFKKPTTLAAQCMLLIEILGTTNSPLPLIFNIHAQFFHAVFPHCQQKFIRPETGTASEHGHIRFLMAHVASAYCRNEKSQEQVRGYFRLYGDRGRLSSDNKPKSADLVDAIGIVPRDVPEFAETTGYFTQPHFRALDCFLPDSNSLYVQQIQNTGIPFVAGPSGHSNCLLRLALMVGDFDRELMQQYALGIAGYLIGGGMHSYHEVMIMAARLGLPYDKNDYLVGLPKSVQCHADFEPLQAQCRRIDSDVRSMPTRHPSPGVRARNQGF